MSGRCSHHSSRVSARSDAPGAPGVIPFPWEVLQSFPYVQQAARAQPRLSLARNGMRGSPWLGILTRSLLPSSPSRRTPGVMTSVAGCSPARSLASHSPASAAPCHGAPKKSLHWRSALAPKIRGRCRLPTPTRVPLPMLCPLPWTCYVYPVPPPSDTHLCTVPSSPTAPVPPVLTHPSHRGPAATGAGLCSSHKQLLFASRSVGGGTGEGEQTPNCPLPSPATDLARLPALGNASLAGETFAPSHCNYRLP